MSAHIKNPIINGHKWCISCKEMKTVSCFNKSRYHLTSKCKDCLSAYAKDYRQRSETKKKRVSYTKEYRSKKENRDRINENARKSRKNPTAKEKRNEYRKAWAAREKQKAVDYMGGKCVGCGYGGCLAAMDFHHLDPNTKEDHSMNSRSFEKNKDELDKCVMVCTRCHREIHAGYRTL